MSENKDEAMPFLQAKSAQFHELATEGDEGTFSENTSDGDKQSERTIG